MKRRADKIIVPTDFSELSKAAVPWAAKMAEAFDAEIHCFYAVPPIEHYIGAGMSYPELLPNLDDLEKDAKKQLESYAAEHFKGVEPAVVVRIGTPFVELVRYARDLDAMMIVMSTHGYSGLKHVVMGSTAEAVLRHAHCPVLTIRSREFQFEPP